MRLDSVSVTIEKRPAGVLLVGWEACVVAHDCQFRLLLLGCSEQVGLVGTMLAQMYDGRRERISFLSGWGVEGGNGENGVYEGATAQRRRHAEFIRCRLGSH